MKSLPPGNLLRMALAVLVVASLSSLALAQDDGLASDASPPLKVWLPAPLIADDSAAAFDLLRARTATFTERANIHVRFRIKAVGTVGGIMPTIRAGSDVAPGALPDIALIRRRDFTPAQARQYLQSLETLFSSSLINELGESLSFGQIPLDESVALYGLPYLLDALMAIATPASGLDAAPTFDSLLDSGAFFHFPAARASGLNQTTYLQYLSAGGSRIGDVASEIDESALLAVLAVYESLVAAAQVSPDALGFQSPAAYLSDFSSRPNEQQIAIAKASDFLGLSVANPALLAATIPTAEGGGASALDGWLWVIVTPDLSRQSQAARYLEWLMEPAFHAQLARELRYLPSQTVALTDSLPDTVDRQFMADLLANATVSLPEGESGAAARLMQEALATVLHGEASAEAATADALAQFATR